MNLVQDLKELIKEITVFFFTYTSKSISHIKKTIFYLIKKIKIFFFYLKLLYYFNKIYKDIHTIKYYFDFNN